MRKTTVLLAMLVAALPLGAAARQPKLLDAPNLRLLDEAGAAGVVHLLPRGTRPPEGLVPTVRRYRNSGEVRVRYEWGQGDDMRVIQTKLRPTGGGRLFGETATYHGERGWTTRYFSVSRRKKVRVLESDGAIGRLARQAEQRHTNRGRRGKTPMRSYLQGLHAHLSMSRVPAHTRRTVEGDHGGHLRLTDRWQDLGGTRKAITDTYRLPDGWRLGFTGHYTERGGRLMLTRGAYFSVSPDGRHLRHMTAEQAGYVQQLGRMPRGRAERRAFRGLRGAWVPTAQPIYQNELTPPLAVLAPAGYPKDRLDSPRPLQNVRSRGEAGATPAALSAMEKRLSQWNAGRARGEGSALRYDHGAAEPRRGAIMRMPSTYEGVLAARRSDERLTQDHARWERTPSFPQLVQQAGQLKQSPAARRFLTEAVADFAALDHRRLTPTPGERTSAVWPNVTALIRVLGRSGDPAFALPLLQQLEAKAGRHGRQELAYGPMGVALMDARRRLGDRAGAAGVARRVIDSFVANHVLDSHEYEPVALARALVLARPGVPRAERARVAGKLRQAVDHVTGRTSWWATTPRRRALDKQLARWQEAPKGADTANPHYRAYRLIQRQDLPTGYRRQLLGALMKSGSKLQLRRDGKGLRIRTSGRRVLSLHTVPGGSVFINRRGKRTVRHRVVAPGAGGHFEVWDARVAGSRRGRAQNRFVPGRRRTR
jgi:hypothetical protein